ncbi:MAG TPA: DUF4097 family beta strand repeat-containing protein [Pyrinomonadaceae bacterium]|jgi:DUF4097 and DUF4098 domain-containing protein YvlB
MKLNRLLITAALLLALASPGAAFAADTSARHQAEEDEQKADARAKSTAAESDVIVNLCVESGDVVVHGWDKREIRARADDAARLEIRPSEATGGAAKPAKRVEVLISNSDEGEMITGGCVGSSNVVLDVPRGATVVLKVRSGDVEVGDVAEARIESLSGDIGVSGISRALEVESISGNLSLKNSSGRIRVRSYSGTVDALDVRPKEDTDYFIARATSGDVNLDRVTHTRIEANTLSGDVNVAGALARGGSYDFKTHSGSVALTLPSDSSFKLNARVVAEGEIITDFLVKTASGAQPLKELSQGRLIGTVGTGDAELTLLSFSGTLHLKKK